MLRCPSFAVRLLAMLVLAMKLTSAAAIEPPTASEAQLKVALIYNFIMFTEWPSDAAADDSPLEICVANGSSLRDALYALESKTIRKRPLRVRIENDIAAAGHCAVLYVDEADHAHWLQVRQALKGKSVLTIATASEGSDEGFIITLALIDNRMVFDVNTLAARGGNLVISSKMLRLARKVK
jgi:hypothetical protein